MSYYDVDEKILNSEIKIERHLKALYNKTDELFKVIEKPQEQIIEKVDAQNEIMQYELNMIIDKINYQNTELKKRIDELEYRVKILSTMQKFDEAMDDKQ